MKATRKDFDKLASIILALKEITPKESYIKFVENTIDILKHSNPYFDADRFRAACGIGDNTK